MSEEHPEILSTEFQEVLKQRIIDSFEGPHLVIEDFFATNETLESLELQEGLKKALIINLKKRNEPIYSIQNYATKETRRWFESDFQEVVKKEIVDVYSTENVPYFYSMFEYATKETKESKEVQEAVKNSILRFIDSQLGNVQEYGMGFVHDRYNLTEETRKSVDLEEAVIKLAVQWLEKFNVTSGSSGTEGFLTNGPTYTLEDLAKEYGEKYPEYKRAMYVAELKAHKGQGWEKYLDDKNDSTYKSVYD